VFTIGKNATAAVKAAVMTEDVAATVWMALQIGTPDVIPQDDVDKLHNRYTQVYGQ
jgi:L-ribulose-5-phosphate 4-epimerase